MGDRKLFPVLVQYNSYTKVVSYPIKYHEDYLSYVKVENLELHSVLKGAATFVWLVINVKHSIILIWFMDGCTIRYVEKGFKLKASGYHYCCSKVTGHSSMTVKFAFFQISLRQIGRNRRRSCRIFQGFFPDFHYQRKGLVWFLL